MNGVQINNIEPSDITDHRGLTYEWCKGILGQQVTIYYRKAGIIAGDHYHKGHDPSKKPELFFLIDGEVDFTAKDGLTGDILEERITKGTEIIIQPGILHNMHTITPVIYVEYRATIFDKQKPDTYDASTYEDYINQLKQKK